MIKHELFTNLADPHPDILALRRVDLTLYGFELNGVALACLPMSHLYWMVVVGRLQGMPYKHIAAFHVLCIRGYADWQESSH